MATAKDTNEVGPVSNQGGKTSVGTGVLCTLMARRGIMVGRVGWRPASDHQGSSDQTLRLEGLQRSS